MQLLYLWIKDYKSIKETGFNFSSEWNFSYDAQQNKLTAERQTSIPKNFFGEEFLDVTVIVGENGTGKSSLLELIEQGLVKDSFNEAFSEHQNEYICSKDIFDGFILLKDEEKVKVYYSSTPSKDLTILGNHDFLKKEFKKVADSFFLDETNIHFPTVFTSLKYDTPHSIVYYSSAIDFSKNRYGSKYRTEMNNSQHYLGKSILFRGKVFVKRVGGLFNVSEGYLFSKEKELICIEDSVRQLKFYSEYSMFLKGYSFIPDVFSLELTLFKRLTFSKYRTIYTKMLKKVGPLTAYIYWALCLLIKESLEEKVNLLGKGFGLASYFLIQEIKDKRNLYEKIGEAIDSVSESDDSLDILISLLRKEIIIDDTFLYSLSELDKMSTVDKEGHILNLNIQDNTRLLVSFINAYKGIEFLHSKENILTFFWRDLSFGERALLNILSRFFSLNEKIHEDNEVLLIAIDEGDLGFHPDWQKKYFSILVKFLPLIFKNQKIQLILSTHSPFILSDIPKSNCIFLKKDEEGYSKVDEGLAISNTFGANIHELLADAFFMEGGLIGDFAKGKINALLKDLIELKQLKRLIELKEKSDEAKTDADQAEIKKLEANISLLKESKQIDSLREIFDSEIKKIGDLKKTAQLVGEPLIRYKLQELVYELTEDTSFIDEEIKRLEQLKQTGRNDKNRNL